MSKMNHRVVNLPLIYFLTFAFYHVVSISTATPRSTYASYNTVMPRIEKAIDLVLKSP